VSAVGFRRVDILFPPADASRRRARAAMQSALAPLDAGESRGEFASRTGVIAEVRGANLAIERGHISVLMGLSGSAKPPCCARPTD
jgi:ABC-type proline/glycine betaine transport system ATPase subunit